MQRTFFAQTTNKEDAHILEHPDFDILLLRILDITEKFKIFRRYICRFLCYFKIKFIF